MNKDPRSHGLWEASAPPAPATGVLDAQLSADVAVIGAGYTGLSCALHLRQTGASVVVLEADTVGFGGSGRNVGLVNAGMWVRPSELQRVLGAVHGPRLIDLLGNAPARVFELIAAHAIDCEPMHEGTLHCAVGVGGLADIQARAAEWQALGAPVEVLSSDDAARLTGTRAYRGALLDRRAGTVQPLAYARGLAHATTGAGARLFTGSRAVGLEDQGSAWRLRSAGGGSVTAPWVVVATNAYSGDNGLWPQLQSELVRLPYFNLATRPLPADVLASILPGRHGAWDTRQVLSSFRLDRAGRLVFGSVGALEGAGRSIHRAWGRRALARLFPQLGGIDFEHEWYGTIGMTQDALPRFHALGRKIVSFSGYNGRGIAPGTVFGRELARLVSGQIAVDDLALPVSTVVPAPWRALREAGYEAGAQLAHLAGARF